MHPDPSSSARRTVGRTETFAPSRGLYVAVVAYLVVSFFRPQDLFPPLGYLEPGLVSTILIALFWLRARPKDYLRDPAIKWQLVILTIMLFSLIVVVNHYHWFWTTVDYIMLLVAFSLGLPAVARYPQWRKSLLHLLLLAFLFIAAWTISHDGVGTAAWIADENDAAAALIVGGGLAWGLWLTSTERRWRLLAILTLCLCAAGIVATDSRGGFVGMVVAVIAALFLSGRVFKPLAVLAVVVLLALPFVPAEYRDQVRSISDPTDSTRTERIYTWRRGFEMFLANPLLGVGPGNFAWTIADFEKTEEAAQERGDRRMIAGRAAHSLFFTLIPELGILGIIAFVALVTMAFRRSRRTIRAPDGTFDPSRRAIAYWIFVGLSGFLAASAFISTLWYPQLWMFVGFSILLNPDTESDERGVISWPRRVTGPGGLRLSSTQGVRMPDARSSGGRRFGNR